MMATSLTAASAILALSLVSFGFGATPILEADPLLRGCSARPESAAEDIMDWGLTVDGEIVDAYRNDDPDGTGFRSMNELVDPAEVKSAQVICWAAVDRMYGVRFRHGIYSIWTTNVFAGAGEFLEEAHRQRLESGDVSTLRPPHDELVLTERDLAGPGGPGAGGFVLELTHPKWQWMCRIASADLPPHPHAHGIRSDRGATAGQPHCFSLHDHGGSGLHEGPGR